MLYFGLNQRQKYAFLVWIGGGIAVFIGKKDTAIEKSLSLQFEILCDLAHRPCEKL
jgi:hypothetical protein